MAEAEGGNRATQHIPMQSKGCYSDLLQRFIDGSESKTKLEEAMKDTEEIELSLGLSLNGRFGVDPKAMKLTRSSSISNFMNHPVRDEDTTCLVQVTRTCSLPTETQEEWRKRKALQSLRRMVAKRKRTEKLRNSGMFRDRVCLGDNCEEGKRGDDKGLIPINGNHQQDYVHNRASDPRGGCFSANGFESKAESAAGMEGLPKASSQGSLGSQGSGGSSGISEFESQSIQGMNKCTEARSPASVQSLPEQGEQKPVVTPGTTTTEKSDKFSGIAMENPSKKLTVPENEAKGIVRNVMEEMPCVSTRGDGPNGKRIEGFLYRYRKGEEVRIVCVCHGSFLSPAEFVKHAGGGDVVHPLRHIVVNPSSLL